MSWYWGVDVGSHAVSIGGIHTDNSTWWRTIKLPNRNLRGGKRLFELRWRLHDWAEAAMVQTQPSAIVVELPTGRHPNPSLMMSAGVVCEVFYAVTRSPVLELPPTKWKPIVGLAGNAQKHALLSYAQSLGYRGEIQDEADALCLAAVCRKRATA